MTNIKLIDQIILTELTNVKNMLRESAANWLKVSTNLKNLKYKNFPVDGVDTYEINDPKLGIVYIQADGNAFIDNSNLETTWTYDGSNIIVNNTPLQLDTVDTKTKKKYAVTIVKKKIEGRDAIDVFQTALDWLGFIPGYGDILDAVNAIIYFARGKYLDGVLSAIAIIPVAGSAIKLGFKGAVQTAGGALAMQRIMRNAATGNGDELIKFYTQALASGKLTKLQLRALAAKGDEIAALLTRGKSYIKSKEAVISAMGLDSRIILKQIDKVNAMLKNTTSVPIKKSFGSKISAAYDAMKASRVGSKGINTFQVGISLGANLVTMGVYGIAKNLVKKLGIGTRELKLLKDAMDIRWAKRISESPTLTTAMFKSNGRLSAGQAASLGIPPWLSAKKTKYIQEWFAQLQKTDPLKWKQVSNNIATMAANAKNPYYMKFVDNAFQQASNIFRPNTVFKAGYPDMFAGILKLDSYRLSNPKNLDIVKNEIEDLAEKLGLDPEENANGVIMPAIYAVFNTFLNSAKDKAETIVGAGGGLAGVAMGAANTIGSVVGIGDQESPTDSIPGSTNVDQAPEAELSSIKKDFKEAPGTTLDKLQALSDKGWSENDIDVLKKSLDIE